MVRFISLGLIHAAATIASGEVLFTLQFLPAVGNAFSTTSTTNLTWDEAISGNCEFADGLQNVLASTFTGASAEIHGLPTPALTNDLTNNTLCAGETATFTASGGVLYEYSVNTTSQAAASATTTFSSAALTNNSTVLVEVTDVNGCKAEETDVITVSGLPTILLTNDNTDDRICSGDPVIFNASGADEYIFSLNGNVIQAQSTTATYTNSPTVTNEVISVVGINTTTGCQDDGRSRLYPYFGWLLWCKR